MSAEVDPPRRPVRDDLGLTAVLGLERVALHLKRVVLLPEPIVARLHRLPGDAHAGEAARAIEKLQPHVAEPAGGRG
ncbi:MAG: hypothetical protein ACKO0W_09555 [Planctomycetota bacterium]